jgi:hypothetical protein
MHNQQIFSGAKERKQKLKRFKEKRLKISPALTLLLIV